MKQLSGLALLLLLGACAPPPAVPGPTAAKAVIEVSVASFSGSHSTQIFADGTRMDDVGRPGAPPSHSETEGRPADYDRAAAVLAREGAKAKAAVDPKAAPCLDYGTDMVRAVPPVAGFDMVSTTCPVTEVSAMMADVLAALNAP